MAAGFALAGAGPNPTSCNDILHKPAADVAYRGDAGVMGADLNPGPTIDTSKIQVPITVDVMDERRQRPRTMGETTIAVATTDGQTTTIQGPAVNGGKPLTIGPDCRPLEPVAEQPQKTVPTQPAKPGRRKAARR